MLLFAHTGIPLVVTWLSQKTAGQLRLGVLSRQPEQGAEGNPKPLAQADKTQGTRSRLDYRLLLLGSMLPDILDKPMGTWLMADVFGNGRIFGHTLLLALILLGIGVYLFARSRRVGIFSLALGCIAHLCLDQMWLQPQTLLWPLLGWSFPKGDVSHWLEGLIRALVSEPGVYIPELIGALGLAIFFTETIRRRKLQDFLRTGQAA
jgi:membrane-bound metal-dependent hydrolase YbcI (DUF457 family)